MSTRGRPTNPVRSVRIVLSGWLNPEFDADILAWLDAIPRGQRFNALKMALRSGGLSRELNPSDADNAKEDAAEILSNWEF